MSDEKHHDDMELAAPIPHKKGDKIDPAIEWENVEPLSDKQIDIETITELDMLEVLEESEKEARKRKRASIEMQGMIALKLIINGADPIEVARRCGFDISDPDHMHEHRPHGVSKEAWAAMGNARTGNRARFFSWLGANFENVTTKQLEEEEDA